MPSTSVRTRVTTIAPRIHGIHDRPPRAVTNRSTSHFIPSHSARTASAARTVGRPRKMVLNWIGSYAATMLSYFARLSAPAFTSASSGGTSRRAELTMTIPIIRSASIERITPCDMRSMARLIGKSTARVGEVASRPATPIG